MDEHIECNCTTCVEDRAEFNAWCDAFGLRWQAHKKANAELAAELETIRATEPSGLLTEVVR